MNEVVADTCRQKVISKKGKRSYCPDPQRAGGYCDNHQHSEDKRPSDVDFRRGRR